MRATIALVNQETGEKLEETGEKLELQSLVATKIIEVPCDSKYLFKLSSEISSEEEGEEHCYTGPGDIYGIEIPTKEIYTGDNTGLVDFVHDGVLYKGMLFKAWQIHRFTDNDHYVMVTVVHFHLD